MSQATTLNGTKPVPTLASKLTKGLGAFALGGAVLVIVVAFVGLTLARFDVIDKLTGFMTFMMMLNPARMLAVIAGIALLLGFVVKAAPKWQAIVGLVLSLALLAVMYTQVILRGGEVPPIHDITTNLDAPPQFSVLDRPEVSTGPFTVEEWRAFHEDAYDDVQAVLIDKSPTEVLADARVLMEDRGWEIVNVDNEAGTIEGTAYAGYLKFRDDVVIKATPVEDGSTRVDMRSVSRVGVSDLGYNAARVEEFLTALEQMG